MLCFCVLAWYAFSRSHFPWGGVEESYLKPIYLGIIFLSGLIMGCTVYIIGLIEEIKAKDKKSDEL